MLSSYATVTFIDADDMGLMMDVLNKVTVCRDIDIHPTSTKHIQQVSLDPAVGTNPLILP